MIKLRMPVIVEGKYDKITLENVVDALIIPTNGFRIFKDKEKCELIKTFAEREGIIVLTDSDSAGNMIRSYIKNIVGNGKIINVYIPQLKGKEKRKSAPSKEGFLGVEGISKEELQKALERSGIDNIGCVENKNLITKTDMFLYGLSGTENSSENRKKLLTELQLPTNLSPNAMLDVLNVLMTKNEFEEMAQGCLNLGDKN